MSNDMGDNDGTEGGDDIVIRGARDYNAPGSVPRDEMWTRIQAARRHRVAPVAPGRRWVWPSAAAAAVLVLGAGILIGRRMREQPDLSSLAASRPVASNTIVPPAHASARDSARVDGTDTLVTQLHEQTLKTDASVRELASTEAGRPNDASNGLAYHLVLLRHLAGSEALITAFRQSAHGGTLDPKISAWSHEMLTTTRILETMNQTHDPTLKRMLDDLDLIITQIVQYTDKGTASSEELGLIEKSIAKRGIISTLRNTYPAGNLPVGT